MSNLKNPDEIAPLAAELPACFIDELVTTEASDSSFESRMAFLRSLALEAKCDERNIPYGPEVRVTFEPRKPMPSVPAGPWRSLGGCFDYGRWQDRERFLELDGALTSLSALNPKKMNLSSNISKWIDDIIYS